MSLVSEEGMFKKKKRKKKDRGFKSKVISRVSAVDGFGGGEICAYDSIYSQDTGVNRETSPNMSSARPAADVVFGDGATIAINQGAAQLQHDLSVGRNLSMDSSGRAPSPDSRGAGTWPGSSNRGSVGQADRLPA